MKQTRANQSKRAKKPIVDHKHRKQLPRKERVERAVDEALQEYGEVFAKLANE